MRNKLKIFGIILLFPIILACSDNKKAPQTIEEEPPAVEEIIQKNFQAQLYFANIETGELEKEERAISADPVLEDHVKKAVAELAAGPKNSDLGKTLPPGSKLRGFYLDAQGCAYLDFGAEIKRNHPGGTAAEILTIASLVKTLTDTFPQIKRVKILINGSEIETLAGHIDTRLPFTPESLTLTPVS